MNFIARHPYFFAIAAFIVIMTFVKLGVTSLVDNYGIWTGVVIAGVVLAAALAVDRWR